MKVAFAASDETVRLVTAEGFQVLSRDGAADHSVVLTEVDPREPRALGGCAAVLLEIPAELLSPFGGAETNENGERTFEVPVSFVDAFPIIATRAGTPAPRARPKRRSLPEAVLVILPSLALILVIAAMYLLVDGDGEAPDEAPRAPDEAPRAQTAPARGSQPSASGSAPAAEAQRRRRLVSRSRAAGSPTDGHLVGGVAVPREGRHFFTWSIPRARSPNPQFRRYGTYAVVQRVLRVVAGYRRAHPNAARVGIADLSLPRGGEFGTQYGGTGHVAHRNGTEVDILYPRRDRKEQAPVRPAQIDRSLTQDLLERFLDAGAVQVKVDGRLGLRAPPQKIEAAPFHEEHMHVRFPAR